MPNGDFQTFDRNDMNIYLVYKVYLMFIKVTWNLIKANPRALASLHYARLGHDGVPGRHALALLLSLERAHPDFGAPGFDVFLVVQIFTVQIFMGNQ